jgi:hypothetical protein
MYCSLKIVTKSLYGIAPSFSIPVLNDSSGDLTKENFALFSRGYSCDIVLNNEIFLAAPTGEDGIHPAVQQGGRIPPLLHSAACQEEGWRRLS